MPIKADFSVAWVKCMVLRHLHRRRTLPGVVRLEFWGCPLSDEDEFWEYGIPDRSRIEVIICDEVQQLFVTGRDTKREIYSYGTSDTVKNLKAAIRSGRDARLEDFVVRHCSMEVQPNQELPALPSHEFEIVEFLKFDSVDGDISLPISDNATVGDALIKLAEHLGLAAGWVRLHAGGEILCDSDQVWQFAGRLSCVFSRRKPAFTLGQEQHEVDVDCDVPFSEVKAQLARTLGIEGDFVIYAGQLQVDDEMTIDDCRDLDSPFRIECSEQTQRSPIQPEPVTPPMPVPAAGSGSVSRDGYLITVCIGIIPRCMTAWLPATATIRDAEAEVVKRFELEGIELEFALSDLFTDEAHLVPKATALGGLDLDKYMLIAQQQGTAASAVADGDDDQEDVGPSLQSLHVTVGAAKPSAEETVSYKFVVAQYEQEYSIAFPPGKTVLDARKAVAEKYEGKTTADITLLFMGKALRDGFVLDRLRIGNGRITVHVRDVESILITTALANRGP
jgi:hypothetical protein